MLLGKRAKCTIFATVLCLQAVLAGACGDGTKEAPVQEDTSETASVEAVSDSGEEEQDQVKTEGASEGASDESVEMPADAPFFADFSGNDGKAGGDDASGDANATAGTNTSGEDTAEPEDEIDPMELYEPYEETVTVMLYMTGSDLESSAGAATKDMDEIAQSGIDTERVNFLIFTGGSQVWHSEDPQIPSDANVLYQLTEDGYEEIARFDPLSMGDPENLRRFLEYCGTNYETDSYDLILWDHGNGPVIGYGSDKQYKGDSLTLPEMREALEKSPFGEDNKLGLIGFDACLMSSAELMCVSAPFARYMVASQETEPHFGWDYDFLALCGKISQEDLAREIVREYTQFCSAYFAKNVFFRSDVTLAAVDLSYAGDLEYALDALFRKASSDISGDFNKLVISRIQSHSFGRASTGSEYDLVDIGSLMDRMEERYPSEARAVREVVEKAVLVSDASVPESCGLSLFYPYFNKNYYKKSWRSTYASLGVFKEYRKFLSRYDQVWLGTDMKELFEGTLVPKAGADNGTFSMQLTAEQQEGYASSCYYILRRDGQEVYTPVFISNDIKEKKGTLTAHFDGNVIYYSDNYDRKEIPVTRMWDTLEGVTNYTIFASAVREENGEDVYLQCQIQAAVNENTGELTVKGIYPSDTGADLSTGKKEPVDLSEWTELHFVNLMQRFLTRDEDGRIIPFFEWPEGEWVTWNEMPLANGINFTYEPLYDDGNDYFIMFEVSDVQGNKYSSELLPVTLAEAPKEQQTIQRDWFEWWGGSELTIYEEEGIRVDFEVMESKGNGRPVYRLHVYNSNAFPVRLRITNTYINDLIYAGSGVLDIEADAESDAAEELTKVQDACRMAGIGRPESLYFGMRAERTDNGGYLLYYRGIGISLLEGIESSSFWKPDLSAKADRQTILEKDGVTAELLGLGSYADLSVAGDLTIRLKIVNHANEERQISVLGAAVDGIYFHEGDDRTLQPGETWYTGIRQFDNYLTKLNYGYVLYDREEKLFSIGKVDLLLGIDSETEWCSVELSERGTQEEILPEGKVIYEDDGFVLYVSSFRKERKTGGKQVYIWEFWAENRSDIMRTVSLYESGTRSNAMFVGYFGPNTRLYIQGTSERTGAPDALDVYLQFMNYYDYDYHFSDDFILEAGE